MLYGNPQMTQRTDNYIIDVIILTYNRAELFRKTLISVCNQNYTDFIIKVIDNGSEDNTEEVFEETIKNYPDRKFEYHKFEKNCQGPELIERRNKIIDTDYVIQFHDDDLMHPYYIKTAVNLIKENPDVALIGGQTTISYNHDDLGWGNISSNYLIGNTYDMLKWAYSDKYFAYPGVIYKSELFKYTKWEDEKYGNYGDIPFLIEISKSGPFGLVLGDCVHYRMHENQDRKSVPTADKIINRAKLVASYFSDGEEQTNKNYLKALILNISLNLKFFTLEQAIDSGLFKNDSYTINLIKECCNEFKSFFYLKSKYFLYLIISLFIKKYKVNMEKYKVRIYKKTELDKAYKKLLKIGNSNDL